MTTYLLTATGTWPLGGCQLLALGSRATLGAAA